MRYYSRVNAARRRQTTDHIVTMIAPDESAPSLVASPVPQATT
jgi:hypothetical protein